MLTLNPGQETGYAPLEHGQIVEINPSCMKVNYGFRFIRGVLTGLVLSIVSFHFFIELVLLGGIQPTIDFVLRHSSLLPYIGGIALLELYLWPSAPPMVFDRVNRRVIFQVLFRTKIIAWDDCVASIHEFVQASAASASRGYNLRIEGDTISHKPGQKPQRAAAMIHQSGLSDDLLNYWEYIRHYMEGGADAVPVPMKLYSRSVATTPFQVYWAMLPKPHVIWQDLRHPKSIWGFLGDVFFTFFFVFAICAMPLVIPLFLIHMLAVRFGRVRRYPKAIRELCKAGAAMTKSSTTKAPAPR